MNDKIEAFSQLYSAGLIKDDINWDGCDILFDPIVPITPNKDIKLEEVYNDMFCGSGNITNEEHKKAFDIWANDYKDYTARQLHAENDKLKKQVEEFDAEIDEMGDYIIQLEQEIETLKKQIKRFPTTFIPGKLY